MTDSAPTDSINPANNLFTKAFQFLFRLSGPEQIICGLPIVWMVTVFTNLEKFPEDKRLFISLSSGIGVALAWMMVLGRQLYVSKRNNATLKDLKNQLQDQQNELLTKWEKRFDQLTSLRDKAQGIKSNLQTVEEEGRIVAEVYSLLEKDINRLLNEIEGYINEVDGRALEIKQANEVVKPLEENERLAAKLDEEFSQGES
ncbi:MAG: hypothetical protein AAF959_25675 [Cyanobacteria bacterium P01_D01_bin.56]